jgi:hypothetical protein
MRTQLLVPFILLLSGCGSVSWVNSVATSPDGKSVVVVGARYKKGVFTGQSVDRPYRWVCARSDSGDLSCQADESKLPQMD